MLQHRAALCQLSHALLAYFAPSITSQPPRDPSDSPLRQASPRPHIRVRHTLAGAAR